jgi:hypothetical protein
VSNCGLSRAPRLRNPTATVNSYSRLTLFNASVAKFEQVSNDNGTVVESFTKKQMRHNRSAPFACFHSG